MNAYLLGHPVAHSLSPVMQNAAFGALGLRHVYTAIDVAPGDLPGALETLRQRDCLGANVTVPYKLAVATALDAVDDEAGVLGAVNTIVNTGGRLRGYNTDVEGAWEGLLAPVMASIRGARVLVAGAGGGARAVLLALARSLPAGPASVRVLARRTDQAEVAAELGRAAGLPTSAGSWLELGEELGASTVLVNCTPLGLYGEDPFEGHSVAGRVVLDLAYRKGGTPLFRRAWAEGAMALQGDQMLLHQGAVAFRLWTDQPAPVLAMRAALDAGVGTP